MMADFIWYVIFLWTIGSILAVIWMAHRNNLRDLNETIESGKKSMSNNLHSSHNLLAAQHPMYVYSQHQFQNAQNQANQWAIGGAYGGLGSVAPGTQWVTTTSSSPVQWPAPYPVISAATNGIYSTVLYFDPVTRENIAIHVDDAFIHLIKHISDQQALGVSRPTLPEGEFSLDELDRAETIISELEGHAA